MLCRCDAMVCKTSALQGYGSQYAAKIFTTIKKELAGSLHSVWHQQFAGKV